MQMNAAVAVETIAVLNLHYNLNISKEDIEEVIATWCKPVYMGYICSECIPEIPSAIFPDAYIVYEEIEDFSDNIFRKKVLEVINQNKFKVGDTIRLKSGGPKMVVKGYDVYGTLEEEGYLCEYFVNCE